MQKLSEMLQETNSKRLSQFGPYKLIRRIVWKHEVIAWLPLAAAVLGTIISVFCSQPLIGLGAGLGVLAWVGLNRTDSFTRAISNKDLEMIGFYFPLSLLSAVDDVLRSRSITIGDLKSIKRSMEVEYSLIGEQAKRQEQKLLLAKYGK